MKISLVGAAMIAAIAMPRRWPYVTDAIWFGKGNQMIVRLKMNGHGDEATMQKARQLMDSLSGGFILDLYSIEYHRQGRWWFINKRC